MSWAGDWFLGGAQYPCVEEDDRPAHPSGDRAAIEALHASGERVTLHWFDRTFVGCVVRLDADGFVFGEHPEFNAAIEGHWSRYTDDYEIVPLDCGEA